MKMTLEATSTYLRETWSASLKSGVRSALKEVGKGWFNLDERSAEVHAVSKLRRHATPHLTPHIPIFRCTRCRSCAASCAWSIL
jgi:hypothetical protein